MDGSQHQREQDHTSSACRMMLSLLLVWLLVGCGGTSSPSSKTATPRPATTSRPGAILTPWQRATPTPTLLPPPWQSVTATPTPLPTQETIPAPHPSSSPCDTPAGVQPVSAAEIAIGNPSRPRIALTFDAGGPADPASHILDILAKHHVHATFFLTGDWAKGNSDLVHRMQSQGHEIANHSMNHLDLRTISDQQVCAQLNQADQVISHLTGVTTRPYYRPPYGSRDARVRSLAAQIGYRTVYWTMDTLDWQETATSDSITTIVMGHLRNGAIILMHAGSQVEAETLDGLMTTIEQQGYHMVTVTEVIQ